MFFTHSILTFVTTLYKCLGLVVAQPRSVVLKAAVALEEGECIAVNCKLINVNLSKEMLT